MSQTDKTPFGAFPDVLADWSDAQSADFAAWFAHNFVADDATREPAFSNPAATERFAALRDDFYRVRAEETVREQGGKAGRSRARPSADDMVWIVSRARGLHTVAAPDTDAALAAGGRLAADRDLKIAGIER